MAEIVVLASSAGLLLIRTEIRDSLLRVSRTRVRTPLEITRPPPLAPAYERSSKSRPSGRLSRISKKLLIPAGENADVSCICVLTHRVLMILRLGNAARTALTMGGVSTIRNGISDKYVQSVVP